MDPIIRQLVAQDEYNVAERLSILLQKYKNVVKYTYNTISFTQQYFLEAIGLEDFLYKFILNNLSNGSLNR